MSDREFVMKEVKPDFNAMIEAGRRWAAAKEKKALKSLSPIPVSCAHEPAKGIEPPADLQDITFYFGLPMTIMSPGIRVYLKKNVKECKGYLSSFMPAGLDPETQEPTATMTFKTEEK